MSLKYTVQLKEEDSREWKSLLYLTPSPNLELIEGCFREKIMENPYVSARLVSLTPENIVFEVVRFRQGKII